MRWPSRTGRRSETDIVRTGCSAGTRTARGGSRQNCKCVVANKDEGFSDTEQVQRLRPECLVPRHNSPAGALCEAGIQLLLQQAEEPQQAEEECWETRLTIAGVDALLRASNRTHAWYRALILFRKTVSAPTANSNRGKGSKGFQGLLRLLDFGPNRAQRQIQAIPESGLATSAPEARRARQLCAAGRAVPPCG